MNASLYIHVPFCERKCGYCDFASYGGRASDLPAYIDALIREIRAARAEFGRVRAETVYFGGGTPSLLSGGQFERIMDALRAEFDVAEGAEVSAEANPGTLRPDSLARYRAAGLNRLSIGVQSFSNATLRALGRIHGADQAKRAVRIARDAGIANVGIDLIYGVPGQTRADWEGTLEKAAALAPEHVSAYCLTAEPGTGLYGDIERGIKTLPNEAEIEGMGESLAAILGGAGYRRYEVSNYARPGFECRHNLNYWARGDYLGLGCAAHSLIRETRYENARSLDGYLSGATRSAARAIPPAEAREEAILLGTRAAGGIGYSAFAARYGGDLRTTHAGALRELGDAGLIETDGDRLRLTPRGLDVQNAIVLKLVTPDRARRDGAYNGRL